MVKYLIKGGYYSVGALQLNGLEQWTFTCDRFDKNRELMGNMFKTVESAEKFLKFMQSYEN